LSAFGQAPSDLFDKAPPPIDDALRARVAQFYQAYMEGKFKNAYPLVDEESQDAFLEADKDKYEDCKIIKITYSDNFTQAAVLESCKARWKYRGLEAYATIPLSTNWRVVDGQWLWHYVKPKFVPSPFSPTGFVPVPEDVDPKNVSVLPGDIKTAAQNILAKVTVDKQVVHLQADQSSQDVIHVRNQMPGSITLRMDRLDVPGLKVALGKTQLNANEETTVVFDYRLDAPEIACVDCAKKVTGTPTVMLYVTPTAQRFQLKVVFDHPGQPQQQPQEQQPERPQIQKQAPPANP
jgi:hypothetical protein